MSVTVEVPQAASAHLPLVKRKASTSKEMEAVKKLEPAYVTLCEQGAEVCKAQGVRSAHIKRSSNTPYIAVTLKEPKTGKRVSIALWKLVTGRWEQGWSVKYRNGSIFDLRLENLETEEPRDEPEPEEEADPKHAPKVADPAIIELQLGLVDKNAEDFQTYLRKVAYKVFSREIFQNVWQLSEDLVSNMLPGLWQQIGKGNVKYVTYEGLRGWAAHAVAFQAGKLGKLGGSGHWGHSIPEKPERAAKFERQAFSYDALSEKGAKAEAYAEKKLAQRELGTSSDAQWLNTFGGIIDGAVSTARRRAGITLDHKPDFEKT